MASRRLILLSICLGALILGLYLWHSRISPGDSRGSSTPAITKLPIVFANRTFDPTSPPSDMPPLSAAENAECDSNFLSSASVSGQSRPTDATHATLTVTNVKVTLQLNITIWVPSGASQHVIEHEDGHRQISESYYETADKVAAQIAETYLGRTVDIAGADLNAAANAALQQLARDFTVEYNRELNPEPSQLLYDSLTDHSRNDVAVKDAVASALREARIASL